MKFRLNYKVMYLLLISFIFGLAIPATSHAAEKDKSARRAALMMQKMKQDMQAQMDAEKAAVQVQFNIQKKEFEEDLKLKTEQVEKLNKTVASLERKNKITQIDLDKSTADKSAINTKLAQTQAMLETTQKDLADLKAQHSQALVDLKFNDNQRKTLTTNLADTTKQMNTCEAKNTKLHQFGSELISIYDKPSSYEAAMRKEQFFQLKRVELENILQNQQDKLNEEKFTSKK
jgi:hypothetical protein